MLSLNVKFNSKTLTTAELRTMSEKLGFPCFIDYRLDDDWTQEALEKLVRPGYPRSTKGSPKVGSKVNSSKNGE